ncbi:uncharacterized protein LOC142550819 [Primulina tabacum]|uniref:uncharacterized protein LOC142550819 n=1 Tax=Primulina tabacum TaxID=48773 RepID=UPI003F5A8478
MVKVNDNDIPLTTPSSPEVVLYDLAPGFSSVNSPCCQHPHLILFTSTFLILNFLLNIKPLFPLFLPFVTFDEAITDPRWKEAMDHELAALDSNHTWVAVDLPLRKRPIRNKWVYKVKYRANGSVDPFKARLVAKGYTQLAGIDYHDNFCPMAKIVTVRCLLSIAAASRWSLHQMEVTNVFIQGELDEKTYMVFPRALALMGGSCPIFDSRHAFNAFTIACRQQHLKLTTTEFDDTALEGKTNDKMLVDPAGPYRRLIGRLLYLTVTRPYVSFAVQTQSQFMQAPKDSRTETHMFSSTPLPINVTAPTWLPLLDVTVWSNLSHGLINVNPFGKRLSVSSLMNTKRPYHV